MSLNWREIDLILEELPLRGNYIQEIVQPDFKNLFLQIFGQSGRCHLRVSFETGKTRLHRATVTPRKPKTRQRFAQLLHSRIKGGKIVDVEHVHHDRVVRIDIDRADERLILWLRLWGGAANCILTNESLSIIDALYRRPRRGEVSGGTFEPPQPKEAHRDGGKGTHFEPRFPEAASYNEAIAHHYRELEQSERRDLLLSQATRELTAQVNAVARRIDELERKRTGGTSADQLQHLGDLLMANFHRLSPGERWIDVDDYDEPGRSVTIELDPALEPNENAQRYYEQARRAKRRAAALDEEEGNLRARHRRLSQQLDGVTTLDTESLQEIVEQGQPTQGNRQTGDDTPGLSFDSSGWRILVGRNSRENDELLRRHTRGNDWWLHARDYPGGYVFVKTKKGKSVPLDVLLDAGNLAVYFSKARANGKADLYYTQVKYLRRAKDGPQGLVLPTQEKNLAVELDTARLTRLMD
jgi:predicted ribosome quality control (RQC) complex YloA/Tae2 family protein